MRNLKRVLSLALALVMVLGMMVITTSAAEMTDADEITYTEAVDVVSAIGVITGYPDGSFQPKGTLTREQGAALICYLLMGKEAADKLAGSGNFTDVAADRWSAGEIDYCVNLGYIAGNGDGTFNPEGPLTAVAYGKLLLCALGYDAKIEGYTGANWATAIAADMIEAGLDVKGVAMDAQLTREAAAQMTLQALEATMVKYDDKGTDITIGDTTINTGASAAEAVLATGDYTTATTRDGKEATMQFCEKYFSNLTKEAGVNDDFGRPSAYSWVLTTDRAKTVYNATKTPVMTYTNGFNTKEYNDLLADGYTFVNSNIIVNGTVDAGMSTAAALAGREYVGTTIEFFNTDNNTKTIEEIVVIQGYLTKVVNIVSSFQTATSNYITLAVYNPWATGEVVNVTLNDTASKTVPSAYDKLVAKYAKNDYLITYWDGAEVAAANYITAENVAATVATVESTKYETTYFSGTFVAGGETYTMASAYAEEGTVGNTLLLGKDYTIYMDANGYVIGAALVSGARPAVHYGIVLDYASGNGTSANNMTGVAARDAYENVKIYTAEGKAEIFGTAFTLRQDGVTIDTYKAAAVLDTNSDNALDAGLNGTLVKYTLTEAGKIDTIAKATATGGLTTQVKGNTFKVDAAGTAYATANTVIFVTKSGGTLTGRNDIAVYTGYANVPAATYTAGSALAANPAVGETGAVSASIATLPGTTTKAQYAVLTDATPSKSAGTKTGEFKFTWTAIVDGVETTVFYEGASESFSADANKLCTITFDAKTGAIATLSPVGVVDAITAVSDGYYTAYNGGGSVVYTDADTVYYQLSARSINAHVISGFTGFAAVDGITMPGAGDTFSVYEYVVETGLDGVADTVFFYVYQP